MTTTSPIANSDWERLRVLWERGWLKGLLLVAAVVFAYQPAWHAGFIWDDDVYVTAQPVADRAGRVETDMVFAGFAVAIFSADLHDVSAGARALGAESGGLSLGQYFAARGRMRCWCGGC